MQTLSHKLTGILWNPGNGPSIGLTWSNSMSALPLYIDGEFVESQGESIPVTDPATQETLCDVPFATIAEDRSGRAGGQADLRGLARSADARAGAADIQVPGAAQAGAGRDRQESQPRDGQDLRRCAGRRLARHRGGRARVQRRLADDGRDRRERRRDGWTPTAWHAAAGRLRGDHAVQFSSHDPAVDVSDCDCLRQHLRAETVRAGSHDAEPAGRAVQRSRRAGRRACRLSMAARTRSTRLLDHPDIKAVIICRLGTGCAARLSHGHREPQARAGAGRGKKPPGGDAGCRQGAGDQQRSSAPPAARPGSVAWRSALR